MNLENSRHESSLSALDESAEAFLSDCMWLAGKTMFLTNQYINQTQ